MKLPETILWPQAGTYILAVSGGVDSVAALDLLANPPQDICYDLVVAHIDHGWRHDSVQDAEFVGQLAKRYSLTFECTRLSPQPNSEAAARLARYRFLEKMRVKHAARAIITAHHWDDRQETSILNLLRGTNRHGLASLKSTDMVVRPLLGVRKSRLIHYAQNHGLPWHEDSTNTDTGWRRNYIRHNFLPTARLQDPGFDQKYATLLVRADDLNRRLDSHLSWFINQHAEIELNLVALPLAAIRKLPLPIVRHLIVAMVHELTLAAEIDAMTIQQAALQLKTGRLKGARNLNKQLKLEIKSGRVVAVTMLTAEGALR